MVTLPVYLSTNGSNPQDVQILAVAARLAEYLVNNDTRFYNATTGNTVKVNVDIRYGTSVEPQGDFTDGTHVPRPSFDLRFVANSLTSSSTPTCSTLLLAQFFTLSDDYTGTGTWNGRSVFQEVLCLLENSGGNSRFGSKNVMNQTSLLGPYTSVQSRFLSGIATIRTTPLVSFSATVPGLSSKNDYPWFYRVIYDDTQRMKAFSVLMSHYGWQSATFLTGSDAYGLACANSLASLLPTANLHTYKYDLQSAGDIADSIVKSGWKVIFFLATLEFEPVIECLLLRTGPNCTNTHDLTYANGYVWVLADAYPLYNVSDAYCEALQGSIVLSNGPTELWRTAETSADPNLLRAPNDTSTTQILPKPVKDLYEDAKASFLRDIPNVNEIYFSPHLWRQEYVPFLMDTVYTLAFAYMNLLNNGTRPSGCAVASALESLSFYGFTGHVAFDSEQDRSRSEFQISVIPVNGTCWDVSASRTYIGTWSSSKGMNISGNPAPWGKSIPSDGYKLNYASQAASTGVGVAIFLLISVAIVVPTVALVTYFRNTRFVRSTPIAHLVMLTLSGVILAATLLPLSVTPTTAACTLEILFAVFGYGLMVVSLGSKAFIYELAAHNAHKRVGKNSNRRVLLVTAIGMVPVIILAIAMFASDAPKPTTRLEGSTYVTTCHTNSMSGKIAALVVLGALSLASLAFAFRNRDFRRAVDGHHLLFALGNTTLVATIAILIAFLAGKSDSVIVATVFTAITLGTLISWALIAGPRMLQIYSAYKADNLWKRGPTSSGFSGNGGSGGSGDNSSSSSSKSGTSPGNSANDKNVVGLDDEDEDVNDDGVELQDGQLPSHLKVPLLENNDDL